MNKNMFFQYNEDRADTGYKSAWLVKRRGDDKFSLIGLTSSVPYPYGDTESFDVNVLQSQVIGQVKGKTTMESVDVPVYHHRDNVLRYEELEDQVLDFMSINSEFVAYRYTGSLEYKPDTAEAEANMATVTVTVVSASKTAILDARDMIIETLCLSNSIPATEKVGVPIDFAVKQEGASPTFKIVKYEGENNTKTDMVSDTNYTVEGTKVTFKTGGLMAITVSASGFASWTTTVYVEATE